MTFDAVVGRAHQGLNSHVRRTCEVLLSLKFDMFSLKRLPDGVNNGIIVVITTEETHPGSP